MNIKTAEISKILTRFLERYSPPASMKDNAQAVQDEAEAILRALTKYAPSKDWQPWVHRVLDRVEVAMKTRAWPTVSEISIAARGIAERNTPMIGGGRGDRTTLSRDQQSMLTDMISKFQGWLDTPGLRDHAVKFLEFWGEPVPEQKNTRGR